VSAASPSRLDRLVFAAGLAVWVVNAVILLCSGYLLGHDEAQYALAAKDLLAGSAPRWFYLSYGMNAIAAPGMLAGGSETALRLVPFVLGIGFVLAVWQLARRTVGGASAAWVVAVLASSRMYPRLSVELLSDMPAAACLIAATAVIVGELDRDAGPRWRLVVVAPLMAAAFYLRYGSCIPIAIIAAVAVVLGWRTLARRPVPVIATGVMFVALLLPHAIMALRTIGSPFGILLETRSAAPHRALLDGLITYLTSDPIKRYGIPAPVVLIAGVLGVRRDRRIGLLWLCGILDVIALGVTTEAQTRYILFGTALLVIVGTDRIRGWIAARPPRLRVALGCVALITLAIASVLVTLGSLRQAAARAASNRGTLAAARAIRADPHGARCHVIAGPFTQVEWYSGCSSAWMSLPDVLARAEPVYVVDPTDAELAQLPGQRRPVLDLPGVAHVIRLDPQP